MTSRHGDLGAAPQFGTAGTHRARSLSLTDATELGSGLAAGLASRAQLRVIVIKGWTAEFYGIRGAHPSSDVDILIEPGSERAFADELALAGWSPRPRAEFVRAIGTHATSWHHASWPCDIDVHAEYPGFLINAAEAFEVVWAHKNDVLKAAVSVGIPDWSTAVLISALHSIRATSQSERHTREFVDLVARLRTAVTPERIEALRQRAEDLGAIDSARPLFDALGVHLGRPTPHGVSGRLDTWRAHVLAGGGRSPEFVHRVRASQGLRGIGPLARAVWPSRRELEIDQPAGARPVGGYTVLRVRRLLRGVSRLPAIIRAARASARAESMPYQIREALEESGE